jgi:hypothetical protein
MDYVNKWRERESICTFYGSMKHKMACCNIHMEPIHTSSCAASAFNLAAIDFMLAILDATVPLDAASDSSLIRRLSTLC